MNAMELDKNGVPDPSTLVTTSSNKFVIHGGPKLYPKEIAGMVVGIFAAVALLVGVLVVVARCVRKRRSGVAAEEPVGNGERYSDTA